MKAIPAAALEAVRPALLKGAEEISGTQRALAPVDTGALRESITVTGPGESTPPYSQPGGSKVVPLNAVAITAGGTAVRYPHLVEFGTVDTKAQPFFWPGFRFGRKRALNRIKRAIGKAIREAK